MTTAYLLPDIQYEILELKGEEGCRLAAYQDTLGVWTIGWGHTGPEIVKGLVWTQSQADAQLEADLDAIVDGLVADIPWFEGLDPIRQDVLADMAFNMGDAGLMDFKNTLALVDSGQFTRAAAAMLASTWASQVPTRAVRLAKMMKTGERS